MKRHSSGRRGPTRVDTESTVRIGATLAIPAILRSLGANPAEVLAEAGFDLRLFDDPDNRIPYAARSRLMRYCAARTGCRHFGLLIGEQEGLHSLGLVGLLVRDSPDVGTALRNLVRYFHLHVRGALTTLSVDGNLAMFGYEAYEPRAEATDQVGDGAAALMFNIMRELCGEEWKPVEVRFVHRKPEDVRPFRRLFGVPLCFDAEQYSVVFSAAWLNRRLPATDPALRRLLQKEIDAIESRHRNDFPEQVRGVLRTALLTGHASAGQIAALFAMPSYTLTRRLKSFGIGFQELVDDVQSDIARQMLEHSEMDVSQIAASLDYSNASAFTRAFRRWTGTTPANWRATRNVYRGARDKTVSGFDPELPHADRR
jgi:AraC-like DNA-binding protein